MVSQEWGLVYLSKNHFYDSKEQQKTDVPVQLGKYKGVNSCFHKNAATHKISKSVQVCNDGSIELVMCGSDGSWNCLSCVSDQSTDAQLETFVNSQYKAWKSCEFPQQERRPATSPVSFVSFLGRRWLENIQVYTKLTTRYDDSTLFVADLCLAPRVACSASTSIFASPDPVTGHHLLEKTTLTALSLAPSAPASHVDVEQVPVHIDISDPLPHATIHDPSARGHFMGLAPRLMRPSQYEPELGPTGSMSAAASGREGVVQERSSSALSSQYEPELGPTSSIHKQLQSEEAYRIHVASSNYDPEIDSIYDLHESAVDANKRLDSSRPPVPSLLPLYSDQQRRTGYGTIFEGSSVFLSMRAKESDVRVFRDDGSMFRSSGGGGGGGGGGGSGGSGGGGGGGSGGGGKSMDGGGDDGGNVPYGRDAVVKRTAYPVREKSTVFSRLGSTAVRKRPRSQYENDDAYAGQGSGDQRLRTRYLPEAKPVSLASSYSRDTPSYSQYGSKSLRASAYRTRLCPDKAKCQDMDCPDAHFKSELRCRFFWDWGVGDKGCQRSHCAFLHS